MFSKDKAFKEVPFYYRLSVRFIFTILFSVIIGFSINYLITTALLEKLITSEKYQKYWIEKVELSFLKLQDHVTENNLSCDDTIIFNCKNIKKEDIYFFLEKLPPIDLSPSEIQQFIDENEIFILNCSDGHLISSAYMPSGRLMLFLRYIGVICGMTAASLILFPYVFRVLLRIKKLYKQILYTQNSNINQPISLDGKDELASLAQGTEYMRVKLVDMINAEKSLRDTQYQLVSTLSHDIRTPLTQLIGYSDILIEQKTITETKKQELISNVREKAERLKVMTDNLLNCVIVNGRLLHDDRTIADGPEFLSQIIYETFCELEDEGFKVIYPKFDGYYALNINIENINRIFDNLFSNILKYADADYPITISTADYYKSIDITFSNRKKSRTANISHHGLGLVSVSDLLSQMNGSFVIISDDEYFHAIISIPKIIRT